VMRWLSQFLIAVGLCVVGGLTTSDNLTTAVTWDNYSLSVNGSRVFIKSVFL
jgi:hypothetical protein